MQLLKSNFVLIYKQLEMKPDKKSKILLAAVVVCSVLSTLYLRAQYGEPLISQTDPNPVAVCLSEGSFLPDVHLVEGVLRSIFNAAKTCM